MRNLLLTVAFVLAATSSAPAQELFGSRIFHVQIVGTSAIGFHVDGTATAVNLQSLQQSTLQFSRYTHPAAVINSSDHDDAELPRITATWVDKKGVTHSVSTPIAGTTPAAMKRAVDTHQTLLKTMQALYPPKV